MNNNISLSKVEDLKIVKDYNAHQLVFYDHIDDGGSLQDRKKDQEKLSGIYKNILSGDLSAGEILNKRAFVDNNLKNWSQVKKYKSNLSSILTNEEKIKSDPVLSLLNEIISSRRVHQLLSPTVQEIDIRQKGEDMSDGLREKCEMYYEGCDMIDGEIERLLNQMLSHKRLIEDKTEDIEDIYLKLLTIANISDNEERTRAIDGFIESVPAWGGAIQSYMI